MNTPRYWIGVASYDHVSTGVEQQFCQVCHGKGTPLNRMNTGDWLIYYSPKYHFKDQEPYKHFTALGQVIGDSAYQVEMAPGFRPFRKDIRYRKNISLLALSYVQQSSLWSEYQSRLRFGHFEISRELFVFIGKEMTKHK